MSGYENEDFIFVRQTLPLGYPQPLFKYINSLAFAAIPDTPHIVNNYL